MSRKTTKDIVLETLQELEDDGRAKAFLLSDGGVGRRVFWVVDDVYGGRAYFEQTETALIRKSAEEFGQLVRL